MDEVGFHARRRADREERQLRRDGKLGITHGIKVTQPVEDPEHQSDGRQPLPAPLPSSKTHRHMSPSLQVMLGPILRYDTVTPDNVYHAFALLVTSDAQSVYEPAPTLTVEYDNTGGSLHAVLDAKLSLEDVHLPPPDEVTKSFSVVGSRIYSHATPEGGQSFWRFKLDIPLGELEEEIFYSINGGNELSFFVPAMGQNMRWVAHSCNGFSAGVDTAAFNGADPLWRDVLRSHEKAPYHVLVGGGDQIYCDPLTREPELLDWVGCEDPKKKMEMPLTPEISIALDRFFFNHYCSWFRAGAFGAAIQQIPMLNMCDDHDIIDGFGSYPDDLQSSAIFSTIGARGFFWFNLFQMFIVDKFDGTDPVNVGHGTIYGGPGAYIPYVNRSFLSYLGPKVYIIMLDCRSERKKDQVCSKATYDAVFSKMRALPEEVEHLVALLGVPIAYPRMNVVENLLESKFVSMIAKKGSVGGLANKFNSEVELLDDLNDHWCASSHKKERNWLVEEFQRLAVDSRVRVSFVSGDVHAASISKFHTTKKHVEPPKDPKYMLQIVSSAIVNTPPPNAVIQMVATFGKKRHKTLHHVDTDETLLPMFETDTDGTPLKTTTVMGRRNYAAVNYDASFSELEFDLRIEVSQGSGTTKGYPIRAPPPIW